MVMYCIHFIFIALQSALTFNYTSYFRSTSINHPLANLVLDSNHLPAAPTSITSPLMSGMR